ncbi:MAG: 5-(carboxyamino)imidazole ribonucleotide synthase [Roseiarcus sp.]
MILSPGATIGILGAGQLGRMLAMAAARLGLRSHVFAPEAEAPAFDVASARTIGAYEDEAALASFAEGVDVVTYEFENVPTRCADFLAARRPVRPDARALAVTQDRLAEKSFLNRLGLKTAPFLAVEDAGALVRAVAALGRPAILKTRRFGYDGKGQAPIREGSNLPALHRALGGAPTILEGFVNFEREVSVVAARGLDGAFAAFDVCENEHERQILARTRAPAAIEATTAAEAVAIARRIAESLDYVGVLAVEMFVARADDGGESLVVNELAPRVHNSGHWTIDGAQTSQFEQHVRAIAGWPLGGVERRGRIEMRNLIGDEAGQWLAILTEPDLCLHLYGKMEARPGRKMGHVTRISKEREARATDGSS